MLSTALPLSNSFNDEALARSYHPGKVILNSRCWIYQCNLGWLVCDWCPLMVLGSAGWILMALDDSLCDMISDKCWCLIWYIWYLAWWRCWWRFWCSQLMNCLQGVRPTQLMPRPRQALHPVLSARPQRHPPWLRPKAPQAAPAARPRLPVPNRRRVLRVPKPRRWLWPCPRHSQRRRPRSRPDQLWPKQWRPKRKHQVSTRMELVGVQTCFFWVWLKTTPRIRHFGSRFSLSISGGCGVPAHSCSQHLPTDNEFANHQRHSAPRFKVSFIEKSAGQMGDTTAGPASLLNAMAKAGNPCCACITAVYQSKLDMDGYGRFTIGWFNSPMVSSWDGCAPHF